MAKGGDRKLFVGTNQGLYEAEERGGEFDAHPIGLQERGAVRYPVVIDRDDPRLLFVGTGRGGMFRSEDAGSSWREINEGIVYKEIWSTAQHPATGELIVGTGPASIFKSSNHGDSWTECEGVKALPTTKDWSFPAAPHIAHVKGLSLHADEPALIFGSVEEGWAIRSRDGGRTWDNLIEGLEFDLHFIEVMPDDPSVVVATSGRGFFRSFDGGETWEEREEGLECRYLAPLVVHPARPQTFYVAAASVPPPGWRRPEGAQTGFFRSDDRGATWHRLRGGLPENLPGGPRGSAGDPEDPDAFFVGMTDGSVWMTEDGGNSFRQILAGLPQVSSIRVTHR